MRTASGCIGWDAHRYSFRSRKSPHEATFRGLSARGVKQRTRWGAGDFAAILGASRMARHIQPIVLVLARPQRIRSARCSGQPRTSFSFMDWLLSATFLDHSSSWIFDIFVGSMSLQAIHLGVRARCSARIYGWKFASLAPIPSRVWKP